MKEREALKLALEKYMAAYGQALEAYGIELQQQQIEADRIAREALEQPEQEPVAVARVDDLERGGRVRALAMGLSLDAALYTTPQRKPLTDEDKQHAFIKWGFIPANKSWDIQDWFYAGIAFAEAAHGIKE